MIEEEADTSGLTLLDGFDVCRMERDDCQAILHDGTNEGAVCLDRLVDAEAILVETHLAEELLVVDGFGGCLMDQL